MGCHFRGRAPGVSQFDAHETISIIDFRGRALEVSQFDAQSKFISCASNCLTPLSQFDAHETISILRFRGWALAPDF